MPKDYIHELDPFWISLTRHVNAGLPVYGYKDKSSLAKAVGISNGMLGDLLSGRSRGSEWTRRAIAARLGYPDDQYETFLAFGRSGPSEERPPRNVGSEGAGDDLRRRGLLVADYSDGPRLVSGVLVTGPDPGLAPPVVAFHLPGMAADSSRSLMAFTVRDDSMEPVIPVGAVVIADLDDNDPNRIEDCRAYVVCLEPENGACGVRFLRRPYKGDSVIAFSPDGSRHPPVSRALDQLRVRGGVILSCRLF